MKAFYHLLGNNLIANITNATVWFALTFWVYLETKSVFATGMVAGVYLVFTAGFGFWLTTPRRWSCWDRAWCRRSSTPCRLRW